MSQVVRHSLLALLTTHGLPLPPRIAELCTGDDVYNAIPLCADVMLRTWAPLVFERFNLEKVAAQLRDRPPNYAVDRAPLLCMGGLVSDILSVFSISSGDDSGWKDQPQYPSIGTSRGQYFEQKSVARAKETAVLAILTAIVAYDTATDLGGPGALPVASEEDLHPTSPALVAALLDAVRSRVNADMALGELQRTINDSIRLTQQNANNDFGTTITQVGALEQQARRAKNQANSTETKCRTAARTFRQVFAQARANHDHTVDRAISTANMLRLAQCASMTQPPGKTT